MPTRLTLGVLLAGALLASAGVSGASAQDASQLFAFPDIDAPIDHGALLFHGNYCGPGQRAPGAPPIDTLDFACQHHDRCTPADGEPSCACNERLADEATTIARSPRQPDDLRALAGAVAAGSALLPCRPERARRLHNG